MTWQPTVSQTKQAKETRYSNFPPSLWPSHHLPHSLSEWIAPIASGTQTGCQSRLTSSHIQSQNISRIHSILSIFVAPASAQTFTISNLNHYTRNFPNGAWLSFFLAPTPLQPCCQSHLSKTKSDYITSLFRIFVFRIKCKILHRTHKAFLLSGPWLPSRLHLRSSPTYLTRGKRSNLEVPEQCFSVCPEFNSLICPSGKLPLVFF